MSTTKTASKPLADRLSAWLSASGASIKSMAKLLMQTRRATLGAEKPQGDSIIIMGNGPSLRQTIADHADALRRCPSMAVNFAAKSPEFADLRPAYYILVDPHFFSDKPDPNLAVQWDTLRRVDWSMVLIVPVKYAAIARAKLAGDGPAPSAVTIRTINAVGIEGWQWLAHTAYRHGRGMPRPRNVLVPAIMSAMLMGYKHIYVVGADHSWMQTISVNDRNEVISVQPHFYKDDAKEQTRVNTEYAGRPLHDVVQSFYVAFKSYHDIARYAASRGIAVYNSTPQSMIDAFERRPLR